MNVNVGFYWLLKTSRQHHQDFLTSMGCKLGYGSPSMGYLENGVSKRCSVQLLEFKSTKKQLTTIMKRPNIAAPSVVAWCMHENRIGPQRLFNKAQLSSRNQHSLQEKLHHAPIIEWSISFTSFTPHSLTHSHLYTGLFTDNNGWICTTMLWTMHFPGVDRSFHHRDEIYYTACDEDRRVSRNKVEPRRVAIFLRELTIESQPIWIWLINNESMSTGTVYNTQRGAIETNLKDKN